jgi:dihydroxy-acid dehydratase
MQSDIIKKGVSRAPARAMLKATGLTDADLAKPLVAIANTWTEVTPCNYHLRALAEKVKEGVRAAGGTPIEFDTITISDGITMGTEGMKASLVSREVIADSIELFVRAHAFDAVVALCGCDKTIPGTVMALARLNLPSLSMYGGSIQAGKFEGRDVTIMDVFEAVGACAAGRMTEKQLGELEDRACPGAGACGGQFTANTMSMAITFLGISPMGLNEIPATDPRKLEAAVTAGKIVMELLKKDIRPKQIITPAALHNAIASVAASPWWPRPAARRTPCCTCSPSRATPKCLSISTTSTASTARLRCSPTSPPAAASTRPICIKPAACASSPSAFRRPGCLKTKSPPLAASFSKKLQTSLNRAASK